MKGGSKNGGGKGGSQTLPLILGLCCICSIGFTHINHYTHR